MYNKCILIWPWALIKEQWLQSWFWFLLHNEQMVLVMVPSEEKLRNQSFIIIYSSVCEEKKIKSAVLIVFLNNIVWWKICSHINLTYSLNLHIIHVPQIGSFQWNIHSSSANLHLYFTFILPSVNYVCNRIPFEVLDNKWKWNW